MSRYHDHLSESSEAGHCVAARTRGDGRAVGPPITRAEVISYFATCVRPDPLGVKFPLE